MSDFLKPQSPLQHKDGAYIYPLTTVDQVILDDNSRLNIMLENINNTLASKSDITEDRVVELINEALGVIENGSY